MYGHEIYKTNDIETASGLKLVVMLYNGAIKFTYIAIEAIEAKKYDIANTNILKAQDIVGELLTSLDFNAGSIAHELSNLYIYINKLLVEGNIQKNIDTLKEGLELLETLKEGWDQILETEEPPNEIKNINISG